jgi:beta-glucosidase
MTGEGGYRVIVDGKTIVDAWARAKDPRPTARSP